MVNSRSVAFQHASEVPIHKKNKAAINDSGVQSFRLTEHAPNFKRTTPTAMQSSLQNVDGTQHAPLTVSIPPRSTFVDSGVQSSGLIARAPTFKLTTPTGEGAPLLSSLNLPTMQSPQPNLIETQPAPPTVPIPPSSTFGSNPTSTGANNLTVSGTIDGKFDLGYIVTVNIGNQLLRGVLYHVHPPLQAHESGPIVPCIPTTRSVKRRKKYKNRTADHPKPNRSAYNFFFAETHSRLKAQCPHMERAHIKMIGEAWSKLTEAEKEVYNDYGRRDKERYRRELQEYRQRLSLVQPRGVLKIRDVARETGSVNSNEVEMGESSNTKDAEA